MRQQLNALIVGAGIVGQRHIKAQKKLGSNVAVYDHKIETTQAMANKYDIVGFERLEEGVCWADIVHVCTPDDLHIKPAELALKAGAAVLCEKPVTTNLKDAEYLAKLTKRYKAHFFVGNNNRLIPSFIEMKKRMKHGDIGKTLSIRTTYVHDMRSFMKQTPWRKSQDYLWGGGIHAIDLAMWLADEPVADVLAATGSKSIKNYNSPEDYQVILKFKSGLLATIWINARAVLPVHKVDAEVYGEKGTMMSDNKSGVLKFFKESRIRKYVMKDFRHERISMGYRYTINREIELVNNFISGKSKTHSPVPTIEEALNAVRITADIHKKLTT